MAENVSVVSSKSEKPLIRENLLKIIKMAENSIEIAEYARKAVHQIIATYKSPEKMKIGEQIGKTFDEITQLAIYQCSPQESRTWAGKPPVSKKESMHRGITQEAVDILSKENYPGIRFDFGISKDGHFVRGYASTEKGAPPFEKKTEDLLDSLFNAWLANNHQVETEKGYFFKKDSDGNTRKLTAEEVEELMSDSGQEFKDYLESNNFQTAIVSRHREYPGEQRLAEAKKATVQKAVEKAVERVMESEEAEKVEPEIQPTGIGPS
ncbi:hypothetical protein OQJ19_09555 [Fluoribacter gormanii]|uniref:Uncharacterized protein n=1 Tax=Fluoribacter gormanii TaxID=464 RepID=A0A377GMG0_9GAMM|nr:hypothetical protein [Fluoribacter gormanii]KTD05055.1 substrate of the Dot/Icm secretion system [Fluoribacter gormanii]MCW8445645.1 hypothetical protein [Fluoribacter gormanii]MCW8470896.1 hypothetical protein [Fluoribacter gormanii]SIQ97219.1 hypothetical protein SAMN05421777_1058 [Fluoribacter gormanii]STO25981.1 Uncharacterised protein [Fluoribacter gormanii]